ncbi:hypothetical protein B0H19DRAFT_1232736 [Mycena capillaripes]|nr:hypothetical protein B0H19DRAFT_1232736 [Mycena capillaripes]
MPFEATNSQTPTSPWRVGCLYSFLLPGGSQRASMSSSSFVVMYSTHPSAYTTLRKKRREARIGGRMNLDAHKSGFEQKTSADMGDPSVCEVCNCWVQKLCEDRFKGNKLCQGAEKNQLIGRDFNQMGFVCQGWTWPPNKLENVGDARTREQDWFGQLRMMSVQGGWELGSAEAHVRWAAATAVTARERIQREGGHGRQGPLRVGQKLPFALEVIWETAAALGAAAVTGGYAGESYAMDAVDARQLVLAKDLGEYLPCGIPNEAGVKIAMGWGAAWCRGLLQ